MTRHREPREQSNSENKICENRMQTSGGMDLETNSHVARCSHQVTPAPCDNHDHPKGHFITNDHPETARAEGQIVLQAKFFRIMVSKRVFYLPELIIFLIRNHQVMHEIPPGDAERPLRRLWLRAWRLSRY